MATPSDTHRAAIRERQRQAQLALKARHQQRQALQAAAFNALGRLANQLNVAADTLAHAGDDPLQRATTVTTVATGLHHEVASVRRAAAALAAAGMTHAEIA